MKTIFILICALAPALSWSIEIEAIGRLEGFTFEFKAKDTKELHEECIKFGMNNRIGHIDDIYVSFNGHKRIHLHNHDGVWHYPKHYCAELAKTSQSIDLTPPTPNEFREAEVQFHYKNYSFTGANEAELFNDCIEQLEANNFREADFVRLRLNQNPWQEIRNHHGWWRGAQVMCTLIDSALFNLYSKSP